MSRVYIRGIIGACVLLICQGITPVLAQEASTAQNCELPVGSWQNEMGSVLVIESVNEESGMVVGAYRSSSGTDARSFPLIGWANDAVLNETSSCKDCKQNHARVFSFTVRWGEIGSITSWTGTCALINDVPAIKTVWNLARPNTNYSWDHINSGSALFTPRIEGKE